jgi:hypothetical protein
MGPGPLRVERQFDASERPDGAAQESGEFEPVRAFDLLRRQPGEFGAEPPATRFERSERMRRRRSPFAQALQGGSDLFGILGQKGDDFPARMQSLILNHRRQSAELVGSDARQLRQFEVSRPELLEVADDPVGLRLAEAQVLRAEIFPAI